MKSIQNILEVAENLDLITIDLPNHEHALRQFEYNANLSKIFKELLYFSSELSEGKTMPSEAPTMIQISKTFSVLVKAGVSFARFEKFSKGSKLRIVQKFWSIVDENTVSIYMETLDLEPNREARLLDPFSQYGFEICENFDRITESYGLKQLSKKAQNLIARFKMEMVYDRNPNIPYPEELTETNLTVTSLFFIAHHYGEDLFIELFLLLLKSEIRTEPGIMLDLLKDWENLRDYPLQWAIAMVESKR